MERRLLMSAATKEYLGLIKKFPLRPIETDAELDQAAAIVDSLLAGNGVPPRSLQPT